MITPKPERATPAEERRAYALVTARDGGVCVRCRRGGDAQRDHRKNRSQGGLTVASNLQLLCLGCHTFKTENPAVAVREGFGVPGWPTVVPAEWPARRYVEVLHGILHPIWVLYGDGGGWVEISSAEARKRMAS